MTQEEKLIARMQEIISDPVNPMLSAAVGVIKNGKVVFSDAVGCKKPNGDVVTADTKYRIASISKLVSAIGVWQLIEQGLIDPEDNVSRYLGFTLRNPAYPNTPITVKMLLSHTSSIRDGGIPGSYNHDTSERKDTPRKVLPFGECFALTTFLTRDRIRTPGNNRMNRSRKNEFPE